MPSNFLWLRPLAFRASGQIDWVQMRHGPVVVHRIWQERKIAVEVAAPDDAVPEFRSTQRLLSLPRDDSRRLGGATHAKSLIRLRSRHRVYIVKKVKVESGWNFCPAIVELNGKLKDKVRVRGEIEIYKLVIPDRRVWRCTVTGISE